MRYNSFANPNGYYFVTFATVGWVDVFTRKRYVEILLDSLKFCQTNKGLRIHAWCIMSNHVHLVISAGFTSLSDVMRDMKKFTARQILQSITEDIESRREWMLYIFRYVGEKNANNEIYQFWQQDNKPIELYSAKFIDQKINYVHENPVNAGIVENAQDYCWSSAKDYCGGKGLLDIELI